MKRTDTQAEFKETKEKFLKAKKAVATPAFTLEFTTELMGRVRALVEELGLEDTVSHLFIHYDGSMSVREVETPAKPGYRLYLNPLDFRVQFFRHGIPQGSDHATARALVPLLSRAASFLDLIEEAVAVEFLTIQRSALCVYERKPTSLGHCATPSDSDN